MCRHRGEGHRSGKTALLKERWAAAQLLCEGGRVLDQTRTCTQEVYATLVADALVRSRRGRSAEPLTYRGTREGGWLTGGRPGEMQKEVSELWSQERARRHVRRPTVRADRSRPTMKSESASRRHGHTMRKGRVNSRRISLGWHRSRIVRRRRRRLRRRRRERG